jgi:PilZ domain-containing protein
MLSKLDWPLSGSSQLQGDRPMSESFSVSQEKPQSSARPERRGSRRAGVSLIVHVRSIDFADGDFQDVRTTINASRKNVYFFSRLDRYYRGMRVRVICPYDPKPGITDLEQNGEVTRVQRLDGGYGIAVAILPPTTSLTPSAPPRGTSARPSSSSATPAPSAAQPVHRDIERRCASRSPFVAPVELIDMRTGSRIQARVADLSIRGCYVDTLNPLPLGSAVRLQIRHADETFDILANVSSSHVGSGMGLVFAEMSLAQRTTLRSWLGETSLPQDVAFSPALPRRRRRQVADDDQLYALRLIHALLRKGILSQSEASELLADPDSDSQ